MTEIVKVLESQTKELDFYPGCTREETLGQGVM